MKFNTNKERRQYWEELQARHSKEEMEKAMATLKPDAVRVLRLHYFDGHSFDAITQLMERSITVIRNHHNRGIYKLHQYFNPVKR